MEPTVDPRIISGRLLNIIDGKYNLAGWVGYGGKVAAAIYRYATGRGLATGMCARNATEYQHLMDVCRDAAHKPRIDLGTWCVFTWLDGDHEIHFLTNIAGIDV